MLFMFRCFQNDCNLYHSSSSSSYPAQQPRSSHSLPENSPPGFSIPGYRPTILDFQLLYILLNSIPPSRARSSNSPSSFWFTFHYSFNHFIILHSLNMGCPSQSSNFDICWYHLTYIVHIILCYILYTIPFFHLLAHISFVQNTG